jgi:hypothetical protein
MTRKPAKKQSAAKKRRAVKKRSRDTGIPVFQRSMALEYLVEVMFANEFANLTAEHAQRLAGAILQMDGNAGVVLKFEEMKPAHRLVAMLVTRAMDRANKIRAQIGIVSSGTKQ